MKYRVIVFVICTFAVIPTITGLFSLAGLSSGQSTLMEFLISVAITIALIGLAIYIHKTKATSK